MYSVYVISLVFIPILQPRFCWKNVYFEFYLTEHLVEDINVHFNIILISTMITYNILIYLIHVPRSLQNAIQRYELNVFNLLEWQKG